MDAKNIVDWSELTTRLQPLSRELYEAMNRREWEKASQLSSELCDVSHALFKEAIKQEVKAPPKPKLDPVGHWYPVLYD